MEALAMDQLRPPVVPYADRASLGPSATSNDTTSDEREDELPEHEQDSDQSVGGGLMSSAGTAIDRGTGTSSAEAQARRADDDEADPVEGGVTLPSPYNRS
jgi:hypothetical protein